MLSGRVVYIDLDTVIIGDPDELFSYNGRFGILSTNGLDNEGKEFVDGYNSSLMLWNGSDVVLHEAVYNILAYHFTLVHRLIHRMDHWLEITLKDVDLIQCEYPGKVVECARDGALHLPTSNPSIVVFPTQPKPHQCLKSSWVKDYWFTEKEKQQEKDSEQQR